MQSYKLYSIIKTLLLPKGKEPRLILGGMFKGLRLNIDFKSQFQLYFGLFECEVHMWLQKYATGINTAIDVGVAHGEYTLYFLKKTSAKKVFACDPSQATEPIFYENLKLNSFDNEPELVYIKKFVSDVNDDSNITLDCIKDKVDTPCLIKIDVDGGEVNILKGAREFLKLSDCRWLIETHSKELETDCINILNSSGYKTVVIPNAWWRIFVPEQRPIAHNRWFVAFKD